MDKKVEESFRKHAEECYPEECCGLLVIFKGREVYIPCSNSSTRPTEDFCISAEEYSKADDMGEIVAVLHSHPNASANPSEADKVSCEATGLKWYITSVFKEDGKPTSKDITETSPSGYKAPLIGRSFQHGVLDCYTLIRDWYKEEKDITLPDFKRPDDWWNDGESDLYREGFPKAGFIDLGHTDNLEIGDVILMQMRSGNHVPNHAAIYIGNSVILHHLYGRLSSRDVYGGFWRDCTTNILRYKGQ